MGHRWRASIAWALIGGTALAGCEPAMTNPAWPATERRAPASAVYVLWRWRPVPPATDGATTQLLVPATTRPTGNVTSPRRRTERAMEVVEVTIAKGQPIGFRRRPDGLLVAVAGPTTRPLAPGHYCWHLLPGNPVLDDAPGGRAGVDLGPFVLVGVVVLAIGGVVAAVAAIDHYDHHAHLAKAISDQLNDDGN
jgi:hypothetical protein